MSFDPSGDSFGVNGFVQFIRDQAKFREIIREIYMTALDSKSKCSETSTTSYPNTMSRASNVDSAPIPQIPANLSTNPCPRNDGGNQPSASLNGGGSSNTVNVSPNGDDNLETTTTPVVPSDVGDNSGSDYGSPVDTTR